MIDRRTFLAGGGAVFLAKPLVVEAQQSGKTYRVKQSRSPSTAYVWARRARACREDRRIVREPNFDRHHGQAERSDCIRCKLPE